MDKEMYRLLRWTIASFCIVGTTAFSPGVGLLVGVGIFAWLCHRYNM